MSKRPLIPPLAAIVFGFAALIDIVVFTGLARNAFVMMLMLLTNLSACAAIYWLLLRYFFGRLPPPEDQSPSRKSSPISE